MLNKDGVRDIANEHIEEILTHLGIEYEKENGWISVQCMFHGGTHKNLKFRDGKFFCFSKCRRTYDIFDVVAKTLDINFFRSVEWVADFLDIDFEAIKEEKIQSEKLDKIKKLAKLKKREKIVYKPLSKSDLACVAPMYHPYILDRFKKETCEYFNIGFGINGVLDGRVVFPIDSPDGKTISLSGRMPDCEKLGTSRYHIIGDSLVNNTLYNISRIKDDLSYIIVVEGFKSVMALYEGGYPNSVATMGSSLSKEQKNLLLKKSLPVIAICDNDEIGERLGRSIYNQCSRMLPVSIINLSDVTDIKKASVDDLDNFEWEILEEMINNEMR